MNSKHVARYCKLFFSALAVLLGIVFTGLIILGGFFKDLLGRAFQSAESKADEHALNRKLAMEALLATVFGNAITKGADGLLVRDVEQYLSCPIGRFSGDDAINYAVEQGWAEVNDGTLKISDLGIKFSNDFASSVR